MNTDAKYADRIAALLAKAESTTAEEAEALTAKAEELMIKYGIEQAHIDAARLGSTAPEQIVTEKITFSGIYSQGSVMMGHYVAQGFGQLRTMQTKNVRTTNAAGKSVRGDQLWLIGFESDVKQCKLLIASLELQCAVALRQWWSSNSDSRFMTKMEQFKEKRQFIISFGDGAGQRLRETRRRVVAEDKGSGTELVLVDRKARVDRFVEDEYAPRKSRGRMQGGSFGGSSAGRAAGRNANVGGTAVSGNGKALGR